MDDLVVGIPRDDDTATDAGAVLLLSGAGRSEISFGPPCVDPSRTEAPF
jgi:hypothetical protein